MPYLTAWIVVCTAAALGTVCLYMLTRSVPWPWLRGLLRWLLPVVLLVPAPVPGTQGEWAPAFVIVMFEALFQRDGTPGQALRFLVAAVLFAAVAIYGFGYLRRRRRPDTAETDPA